MVRRADDAGQETARGAGEDLRFIDHGAMGGGVPMGGGEKFVEENRREFGIVETPEALAEREAGVGVEHMAAAFERGCGLEGNRDVGIDRQAGLARQQRDFIDGEAVALDGQFMRLARAPRATPATDQRPLGPMADISTSATPRLSSILRSSEKSKSVEAAFLAGDAVVDGEPAAHDPEMIEHRRSGCRGPGRCRKSG